ncbi:MAG TPA: flagellar hook-length control protein FliK [Rhodocyclaceae bacterium]|nr:flagellar hook-length control protein FliK [Rhodocyclaceae bacterium]
MTAALSLPVTPAPQPNNAAAQTTASTDNTADQPPFASVLQQKVQAKNAPKDNQSNAPTKAQAQAAAKSEAPAKAATEASSTTTQQTENTDAASAKDIALATGSATTDTLQTLLPWMLSMQQAGQKAASSDTEADSKAGTSPTDALSALLNGTAQPVLPGLSAAQNAATQASNPAANDAKGKPTTDLTLDTSGKTAAETGKETATSSAILAAASDSALKATADKDLALPQGNTQQGSFDAALQSAREQTTAHVNNAGNTQITDAARTLQAPLGSTRWQNELGEQVRWMSNQNESKAELVLTPPQLGRIEISLNISGDQASANFVSANPQVREALEGAMDRLREVLAGSGITLGQANVGAESTHQGNADQQTASRGGGSLTIDNNVDSSSTVTQTWMRQSNNMLDVFA